MHRRDRRTYGKAAAVLAVAVLGGAVLAGCQGDGTVAGGTAAADRAGSGASRTPTAADGGAYVPVPPPTAAGADLRACFDGSCEIAVAGPVTIPVDGRFGFSTFRITRIGAGGVTVEATGDGTSLRSSVGPGGTAALNAIAVRVRSVSHGTALLSITSTA